MRPPGRPSPDASREITCAFAPADCAATGDGIAAVAGERVLTVAEVDRRLRLLRSGPLAARLPGADTPGGRNLRRWLVQVMVAESLAVQEAARLGLPYGPAGGGLTLAAALRTGGVAAAVLALSPAAGAVCRALAPSPSEEESYAYYRRNLDRFTTPETRWVRPFGPVRRGEIAGPVEDAVFAAREGETVGPVDGPGGPWTLVVERVEAARREPYEAVRDRIRAELAGSDRDRAFARWLDARQAESVLLMPGYEHPADPAQPDADHRH